MVGAATLKGVGVSSFTQFITKAGKTALATGAGAAGAALLTSKFGGLFTNNQSEFTTQGIYLHVPQSVITAYQANWDESNLGLAGRLGSEQDFSYGYMRYLMIEFLSNFCCCFCKKCSCDKVT